MIRSVQAKKIGPKDFVVYVVIGTAGIRFECKADSWEAAMRIVDLVILASDLRDEDIDIKG